MKVMNKTFLLQKNSGQPQTNSIGLLQYSLLFISIKKY